ncbi:ABC transporter permease [uncultured Sunxiuqinia sp.]|uniref:ABC transporter permease n=1 Tax=uncultured Sunxiuqinia sp. TaxID=1573825 RepID=UPI002AA7CCE4|nr:ABC transporter permease [uncultured Sunxiuqinia sp.]
MMLLFRLIFESFSFAGDSMRANKLRTFLSLLGITIGIFAIISVFTIIDSLENYIRSNLNALGSNMVYIQKWPWTPPEGENEYPWWKYQNRPFPKLEEAETIVRNSQYSEYAVFLFGFSSTVEFGNSSTEGTEVLATTSDLIETWSLDIDRGRYFTDSEMRSGAPMAVVGSEIVNRLFKEDNPIGKEIKVNGHRMLVIGTYKKQGSSMVGTSMDKRVHIPVMYASNLVDFKTRERGQTINVKANPDANRGEFTAELEGIMRSLHRLKPMEENDFAINEMHTISDRFEPVFKVINIAGWIIGGFSIVVGGFGIANIMFVSVKERTRLIGIQKALGAKKYFILLQFIFEAVFLSLMGGAVGLFLIFIGTSIFNYVSDMTIAMNASNVITGFMISAVIGILSGFFPALIASRLDPVKAMGAV